jgi:hypothetical protein
VKLFWAVVILGTIAAFIVYTIWAGTFETRY